MALLTPLNVNSHAGDGRKVHIYTYMYTLYMYCPHCCSFFSSLHHYILLLAIIEWVWLNCSYSKEPTSMPKTKG